MNLFFQPLIPDGVTHLDEDESRHCIKVLRHQKGDEIHVTDGKGFFYDCVISDANPRRCTFTIRDRRQQAPRDFSIHIAIAPTKNADRIEWFVEKAVEIGTDKITLINCENSERSYIRTDRLMKVAISAMKQSVKAELPEIVELSPLQEVVASAAGDRYIAYVDPSNPVQLQQVANPSRQYTVLIGPEGDFTGEEVDAAVKAGFIKVGLGPSRLRTETAGMVACHILNLLNATSPK